MDVVRDQDSPVTSNVLPFRRVRPEPQKPILLRTSERKTFKRCPAKWWWAWREGLVPVDPKPGPLWFGTGLHLVWQHYYGYRGHKRGKTPLKVWREFVGDTMATVYEESPDGELIVHDALELGEAMIGAYLDKYQGDPQWYVLATEYPFEQEFKGRDGRMIRYAGKLDLVARNEEDGLLYLWDHKHVKTIDTRYLALDDQAGSYWAVAPDVLVRDKIVPEGTQLAGIMFNFLRKALPDDRPVNEQGMATNKPQKAHFEEALAKAGLNPVGTVATLKERAEKAGLMVLGDVSARQPKSLFARETVWRTPQERHSQLAKIVNEAQHMNLVRTRQLPILKNPTSDCSWDCPFVAMCELQEQRADWRDFKGLAYRAEDPYADHRI